MADIISLKPLVFIILFILIVPGVASASLFETGVELGSHEDLRVYYDRNELDSVRPILICEDRDGNFPEQVFGRIAEYEDSDLRIAQMFAYWHKQTSPYFFGTHRHDYEFVSLWYDPDTLEVDRVVYNEWHYIIGRDYDLNHYQIDENDTYRTAFEITVDFGDLDPYDGDGDDFNETHINYSVDYLNDDVLREAHEDIGFDSRLYAHPRMFWKEGTVFDYDRMSAFHSKSRSILVSIEFIWRDYLY